MVVAENLDEFGESNMTHFIVMTSSASMPSSCWGRYRNVAIVEVDKGYEPPSIDSRNKRIHSIQHFGPKFVGYTDRCAYNRTLHKAEAEVAELNSEENV